MVENNLLFIGSLILRSAGLNEITGGLEGNSSFFGLSLWYFVAENIGIKPQSGYRLYQKKQKHDHYFYRFSRLCDN